MADQSSALHRAFAISLVPDSPCAARQLEFQVTAVKMQLGIRSLVQSRDLRSPRWWRG
jgi:hypothetical protein